MVFFTCDACGESLKKAQVDKHLLKCRGCRVLSCIDCGNDFCGDDYKNHNKCISEDQKYGGKDFQAKANKGDVKQQQWIQRIQEASDRAGVQPRLQQVLRQVAAYGNVPRKRAKFQNWMKNSLKIHSPELLEQVWEIFSAADSDQTEHQTAEEHKPNRSDPNNGTEEKREERKDKKSKRKSSEEQNGKKKSRKKRKREEGEQNGQNAEENTKRSQKKRKEEASDESLDLEGEEPENLQSESNSTGKFNWKGTIKAVLRDAPEDGLAVKKLRKKVLAAYYSFTGDGNYRSEEEVLSLFNKKINNNPKFKTLKEKVRLVK